MAEIKVNVTAGKQQKVTVSSTQNSTEISASADTGRFWAQTAKNWAVSDVIVDNTDYSSKHYAKEAKENATTAKNYESSTKETYNSFLNASANALNELKTANEQSLENIEASKVDAVDSINTVKDESISNVENKANEALTLVNNGITQINTTKNTAVDSINSTKTNILKDIEFVAEGEKEEIRDLANDIKEGAEDIINRVSLSMFDTILKDHVLTYEESKGLALQGTYVYKDAIAGVRLGYPDFYAQVVKEYNEATETETVNDVTVKIHANGHKFYNIADKTAIDNFFNTMGLAWFYGVDTEQERVFLPRDNYFAVKGVAPVAGNGMTLGLTDGTKNYGFRTCDQNYNAVSVAEDYGTLVGSSSSGSTAWPQKTTLGLTTDSTKSGIEAHLETNEDKYLYICVGNTVSNTSWVDVVTQVKGGVKDLEDATNEGISALANASNALRTTQITNCLLEVPQNIKLELNNGSLILKAGSTVTVPNGFEADGTTQKFKEVEILSDKSVTRGWNDIRFLFLQPNGSLNIEQVVHCHSGDTQPAETYRYQVWYDTANNLVKTSSDGGTTWVSGFSLPICKMTTGDGVVASIDQVFNGFGYIGSTVWIDKGVKGLIPNGRNEDGTLNNIEAQSNALDTITFTNDIKGVYFGFSMDGAPQLNGLYSYDEKGNYVYNGENKAPVLYCGTYDVVGGKITNFQPKQPFRAVDASSTPHITETYVNGTSWYRVWSDGWKEQGGKAQISSEGQKINLLLTMSNTNYHCLSTGGQSPFGNTVMYGLTTNSFQVFTADDNSFNAGILFWEVKGY